MLGHNAEPVCTDITDGDPNSCYSDGDGNDPDDDAEDVIHYTDVYDDILGNYWHIDNPSMANGKPIKGTLDDNYEAVVDDPIVGEASYNAWCDQMRFSDGAGQNKINVLHEATHALSDRLAGFSDRGAADALDEHVSQTFAQVVDARTGGVFSPEDGKNAPHDSDLDTKPPLEKSELSAFPDIHVKGAMFDHMYDHLVRGDAHRGAYDTDLGFDNSTVSAVEVGTILIETMKWRLGSNPSYAQYANRVVEQARALSRNTSSSSSPSNIPGHISQSDVCWLRNAMGALGYGKNYRDSDCDGMYDSDPSENDTDNDGVKDRDDLCDKLPNPGPQPDMDNDGKGDKCDNNIDGDDYKNWDETPSKCQRHPPIKDSETTARSLTNPDQHNDLDGNGDFDRCDDPDDDGREEHDRCPYRFAYGLPNSGPVHGDSDGDGIGNECDIDRDGDGVNNGNDNCPKTANAEQTDTDGDGKGDACSDRDGDFTNDLNDNCPDTENYDQSNVDGDSAGDACDDDIDGDDNKPNSEDKCPDVHDSVLEEYDQDKWTDTDQDGYADGDPGEEYECDNCPDETYNPSQDDLDRDGVGDACDSDKDGDGIQEDGDGSGTVGDNPCDSVNRTDCDDNCPEVANPKQTDEDGDGTGDRCQPTPRPREYRKAVERTQMVGLAMPEKKFPTRAPVPVNRNEELPCAEVCGGGDWIPRGYKRKTTVSAPRRFGLVLTNQFGQKMRTTVAEYNSTTNGFVADMTWKPEIGSRAPAGEVEGAVRPYIITEFYFIRILPLSESGTETVQLPYELDQTMVEE